MRQPFWCFWAEGIMGEGAAFLIFAASENHATSETLRWAERMAQPSPSRLCRATSPERERLWQGRKVYSLTADFFLSLNSKDETCRFCQGLPLSGKTSPGRGKMSPPGDKKGKSCRRRRLRGFFHRTNHLHYGFSRSVKHTGHTGFPPVTARFVLSRNQRACPMRKKLAGEDSQPCKKLFRFLFLEKGTKPPF